MMLAEAIKQLDVEKVSWVFEHSITWEDDVWKTDPFDVEQVHKQARRRFLGLLDEVASGAAASRPRILLFHGNSGAGKTHLIRALRTYSHAAQKGYFGYAQMTPDVSNYAEYFLRRLINSLEKPYQPLGRAESALLRLSDRLAADAEILSPEDYANLREADVDEAELADLIIGLADEIVASPKLAEHDIDINIVRALLYLQRADPRIDQRVRQYLYGRQLNGRSQNAVAALDPNEGEDRPFEIIESIGRLMHAVDGAALVFCIDQVEDLRFFDDATERFQRAVRDLIQLANRVPSSIVLISCLGDFYEHVREQLPQSYIDRIEKAGPELLSETRTREEVELMITQRLRSVEPVIDVEEGYQPPNAADVFGPAFLESVTGLSSRKVLEEVHARWCEMNGRPAEKADEAGSSIRVVADNTERSFDVADVPVSEPDPVHSPPPSEPMMATQAPSVPRIEGDMPINEKWDRFSIDYQVEIPTEEPELVDVFTKALLLCCEENGDRFEIGMEPVTWLEDVDGLDIVQKFRDGRTDELRIFMCNKGSQGGGLKRQLERVLVSTDGKPSVILRAGEFAPNPKSVTSRLMRQFLLAGGRRLVIPIYEWERMISVQAFHSAHYRDAGFSEWLTSAKLISDLPSISQILRLGIHASQQDTVAVRGPVSGDEQVSPQLKVPFHTGGAGNVGGDVLQSRPPASPVKPKPVVATPVVEAPSRLPQGISSTPSPVAIQPHQVPRPLKEVANARRSEPDEQPTTSSGWMAKTAASILGGLNRGKGDDEPPAKVEKSVRPLSAEPVALGGRDFDQPLDLSLADISGGPLDADIDVSARLTPVGYGDAAADETDASEIDDDDEDIYNGDHSRLLHIGHAIDGESVDLSLHILKRHCAVLGGSGSGKTTLALSMIEQLLMKDIPVILIDRKGDLSSYANPDVWRHSPADNPQRCALREELGSSIDVAVYTPGQTTGRPIGITLLPNGISELPEHEQQQLANVSAAALADMLHLRNSATHQRQGGVLSVALKILGATATSEVTLADLIYLLETEDIELTELTQRMDPSGKLRRDLIAQLDSLRHRNWALFEGGGEPLRMESLLGRDTRAKTGRNRLSVIYTGFLGDNQNILFWVSQFLSEALRFCQRNPADELQAVIMFDEADLYIPANAKPATKDPLESLLKRARSAGIGLVLATQSPGDLDYKSRDQITSWFIGKVREDTALKKLKAAFASDSGIDPAMVLPNQTVGEFHLIQENVVQPIRSQMSLIQADQVPFDKIEHLARETRNDQAKQLDLGLLLDQ